MESLVVLFILICAGVGLAFILRDNKNITGIGGGIPNMPGGTTPTNPTIPGGSDSMINLEEMYRKVKDAILTKNIPSNLSYVVNTPEKELSKLNEIIDNTKYVSEMFNVHPAYILGIAYAETYFGYNLYDPIGVGFGLSQMETITGKTNNTLIVTAKYITNKFLPVREVVPYFATLKTLTDSTKLNEYIFNAQQNRAYIDSIGQTIITDDSSPLISIPINLMLIGGYIRRIQDAKALNVRDFDPATAELVGFYYHKGIGASNFDTWANRERYKRGYLWRIKQITQFVP